MASLAKNAVMGAKEGFSKTLQLEGVGYRAALEGRNLILGLGFSHPIKYNPPTGVKVAVEKNIITISGINKALVGEAAAKIRKFKKPDPYQGKGIRYQNEIIRRKAGKKAATADVGAAG
jgi:large subunit ribosomal protein L6